MSPIVKVLVVDDSAFARLTISKDLQSQGSITVIGVARDGAEALEKIKELKPDAVTLDVEMPRMDGLATLQRIMQECPTPVIMLSSLTGSGTDTTIRSLEYGAVDFFLKPSAANPTGTADANAELISKVITTSKVKLSSLSVKPSTDTSQRPVPNKPLLRPNPSALLIIGSSTGGPRALHQLVPALPASLPATVIIVQHMPSGFTRSLADRLYQTSSLHVKEAEAGDSLYHGRVLVAPGGYHMVLSQDGVIELNKEPTVNGVRPAIDVTMRSLVKNCQLPMVGVILTGMGSDGTSGSIAMKLAGAGIIAEDKSTCVVWGMPRSVVEAGAADSIVPLPDVAGEIQRLLGEKIEGKNGRQRVHLPERSHTILNKS